MFKQNAPTDRNERIDFSGRIENAGNSCDTLWHMTRPDSYSTSPSVPNGTLPAATANRLGLYLRELQHLLRSGVQTVKSNVLRGRLGLSDSQIRRDLALFGEFGKRGVGYDVSGLVAALRKALGTDGQWNIILVGLGNLGNALVRYRGFQQQGFRLKAVFEADASKVNGSLEGVPIYSIDRLEEIVPKLQIQFAMLAVPVDQAPSIANRLANLRISGILNFASVSLAQVEIPVVNVDLAIELQRLAFAVVNSERTS
jgi:redox-sensing transcriptional repressor